jgi:propane monooxygenase coupling protein
VTTTAASAFGAVNATSSNRAGITLMNDQVGHVIAEIMRDKPGVTVTYLPSMIRVDADTRMDFVYDELAEALGEEPGSFTSADLEESMSTHYGRMVHEDDRTIMFANPEDAAEYLGFDLRPATAAD